MQDSVLQARIAFANWLREQMGAYPVYGLARDQGISPARLALTLYAKGQLKRNEWEKLRDGFLRVRPGSTTQEQWDHGCALYEACTAGPPGRPRRSGPRRPIYFKADRLKDQEAVLELVKGLDDQLASACILERLNRLFS